MTDPWCWYINANTTGVYWWDPCYHIWQHHGLHGSVMGSGKMTKNHWSFNETMNKKIMENPPLKLPPPRPSVNDHSKRCGRAEVVTNRGEVTVLRWNRRIGKTNHSTKIHRTWINWHLDLPWFSGFLPSGNLTVCYWKWSFIVSFPINSMVIFQ